MNNGTNACRVSCSIIRKNDPDDTDDKLTLMHEESMTEAGRHVQWSGAIRVTIKHKLQCEWSDGNALNDILAVDVGYEDVKK